jgi:phosphoribosylformylglycinamidine cyclo-ligase
MAGFAVGLVERASIIDGSDIALGHRLIGLPSSGLHSNGYSLARRIVFGELGLAVDSPLLGSTVADVLLAPTRIYASSVLAVLKKHPISGLVHVTGGGLLENVPRVLPLGCQATIFLGSWARPPIFDFLAQAANLGTGELYRTFNMGLGLVLVVAPREVDGIMGILQDHGENPALIGEIAGQAGQERVVLVDGVYQPGGTAL